MIPQIGLRLMWRIVYCFYGMIFNACRHSNFMLLVGSLLIMVAAETNELETISFSMDDLLEIVQICEREV
jgi:hypothetical protein